MSSAAVGCGQKAKCDFVIMTKCESGEARNERHQMLSKKQTTAGGCGRRDKGVYLCVSLRIMAVNIARQGVWRQHAGDECCLQLQ